jgi:membrane fusion protein (multidrug efflux system)/multidrug efflux system membrane fusion protein
LAKTIVSAPISGRVGSIPVKVGELVSPGQTVASVLNTQSLQVKAFVSNSDYSKISYGSEAVLDNGAKGIVTKVAPSIDPNTKKVEVRIVIDGSKTSGLVIGESVRVEIIGKVSAASLSAYLVPIQNVKIVPGEASVYTVDENSKIKKNPVILGDVKGDFVEVKSGINDNMQIVSPVYELEEGDTVVVR